MTKREMFVEIINLANKNNRTDIMDFANKEIELIEKRANTETKAQKAKKEEREELKKRVLDLLLSSTIEERKQSQLIDKAHIRACEIAEKLDVTTQKIVPILKTLVAENKLEAETKQRAVYYSLVMDENDTRINS